MAVISIQEISVTLKPIFTALVFFFGLSTPLTTAATESSSAVFVAESMIGETMSQKYVVAISSYITTSMLILLLVSPIVGGLLGALIAKGIFKKHFEKAGIV